MDPYDTLPGLGPPDFGPLRPDPNAPPPVRTPAPDGCNCPAGRLIDRLKRAFPNATVGPTAVVVATVEDAAGRR